MPRVCTICTHEQRAAVERALMDGNAVPALAALYRVSEDALHRHKTHHLPARLARAQEATEAAEADDLLAQLQDLHRRTLTILNRAERKGELRTALSAIRECRGNLELLAELSGELDRRAQVNVLVAPEWLTIRAMLMEALQDYPEARVAVTGHLMALEGDNGHVRD